jgi:hypothetical protein
MSSSVALINICITAFASTQYTVLFTMHYYLRFILKDTTLVNVGDVHKVCGSVFLQSL